MTSGRFKFKRVQTWPSHHRFVELVDFCIHGKSHPYLQTCTVGDHIADTVGILHDDIDQFLWARNAEKAGLAARKILRKLEIRVLQTNDLNAAETLYAIATEAAHGVLNIYLRHRKIFDQITPQRKFLPSLFSIHPDTAKIAAQMFVDSKLGTQTEHARQAGSRAYFISDSAANIYARAIIESVKFNRDLEPISCQQDSWKAFDRKEGVRTVVLPFPRYVKRLDRLPVPITPQSILAYWRIGKEMILEEMPDFHLRPEWEEYRNKRKYQSGAKTGAIQHAIFKDILSTLKTIAGANRKAV